MSHCVVPVVVLYFRFVSDQVVPTGTSSSLGTSSMLKENSMLGIGSGDAVRARLIECRMALERSRKSKRVQPFVSRTYNYLVC